MKKMLRILSGVIAVCMLFMVMDIDEAAAAQKEKYADYTPYSDLLNTKVTPKFATQSSIRDYTACPEEFKDRQRPKELPFAGYGILHGGEIPIYFSKSTTGYGRGYLLNELAEYGAAWLNYENSRAPNTAFKYAYPYSNVAFWYYTDTRFEVLEYDKDWVTVWSIGGWSSDTSFLGCGYSGLSSYHKPGVYYIQADNVYIIDKDNLVSKKPEIKAYGSAAAKLILRTTDDEDYSTAGITKINQKLELTDVKPQNGKYKVYCNGAVFYVNADFVNLKEKGVKKPTIAYTAKVSGAKTINIRSKASLDSDISGKAKEGTAIEVIEKGCDGKFSKIWYNSEECYVLTELLGSFRALANSEKQAIGTLAVDTASKAWGIATYRNVEFSGTEKSKPDVSGSLKLNQDESAPVLEVKNYEYSVTNGSGRSYTKTENWYKVVFNGEERWARGTKSATYYPGNTLKCDTASSTQTITVNNKKYEIAAYNIKGSNYFKIRDIAQMLSGTSKTADVEWDKAENAINLVSGFEYTPVGGELQKGNGQVRVGTISYASLNLDGTPTGATCYNIDGNNYYKLRDVLEALDCKVEWDKKTKSIAVTTGV